MSTSSTKSMSSMTSTKCRRPKWLKVNLIIVSVLAMQAVRRRVSEGATAVVQASLAKRVGLPDFTSGVQEIPEGKGRFILTDDFSRGQVWQDTWPNMGHPDEIRYRYAEHTVVLRRVTDDEIGVEIDGKPAELLPSIM